MKKSASNKNAKIARKKLQLDRQTVRRLERSELGRVAGGPGEPNTDGNCTFHCSWTRFAPPISVV